MAREDTEPARQVEQRQEEVTPSKREDPQPPKKADSIRVRVIKEHCGIEKGAVLTKPYSIAIMMIEKGYYEAIPK